MRQMFVILGVTLWSIRPVYADIRTPAMTPAQAAEWAKTLPPGSEISFETVDESASGTGASGKANGDENKLAIDGSAPTASLPGVSASGGSLKGKASALMSDSSVQVILAILGALCLIGAGVCVYLRTSVRAPIVLGVLGAAFICSAVWLPLGLLILAGAAACVAGPYLWAELKAVRSHEALRAVAAGVSDLKTREPTAHAAVTDAIGAHADDKDKKTIKAVRRADDLE